MLDDSCDRQVRRWQQAGRGLGPLEVDKRGRCNRSVLVETLHERRALVPRLEVRVRNLGACHRLIVAGRRAPPTVSRRS
jgi:hypothetical protein